MIRLPSSLLAAAAALLTGMAVGVLAQSTGPAELKMAFVYNFAKFVEWPAPAVGDDGKTLRLCVAGEGAVANLLPELAGRTVQNRTLAVRTISSAREAATCHMVFASGIGAPRVAEVLQAARGLSVLTVSDVAGFADAGGVIGLVQAENRLQFEINLTAARAGGLRVSAHLLKLASTIIGRP